MIRSWFAFVTAAVTFSAFAANTWYVDDDNYGKTGLDGASEATAFGTIQDAIDASKSGDTILVLPGTYDKGGAKQGVDRDINGQARVFIRRDNLTIKSTGGKEATHIVGYKDPESPEKYHGAWSNAVACVIVHSDCPNVIFEGFTLRDGARCTPVQINSNSSYNNGGGFGSNYGERANYADRTHVIDCVISNCVGRLGPVNSCTLHRCLVTKNIAIGNTGGTGGTGAAIGYAAAENSVFINNIGYSHVFGSTLVNCIVVGGGDWAADRIKSFNSIHYGNRVDADTANTDSRTCYTNFVTTGLNRGERYLEKNCGNCVLNAAYTNVFFSPVVQDFRLVTGSAAINRGDPQLLRDWISVPQGYEYKDFYGNKIDMTAATIHAGVSQTVVEPVGGTAEIAFGNGNTYDMFLVNGRPLFGQYGNIYRSTNALDQLCFTAAYPEQSPLSCVFDNSTNVYHFVTRAGKAYAPMPKLGKHKVLMGECATAIYYVDPDYGDDSFDGSCAWAEADPSAKKGPWKTLMQAATNAVVSTSRRVRINCAPGRYDEGETGDAWHARVKITGGRRLHFAATGAVNETLVVGKPDPKVPEEKVPQGCGPNAVRCILNGSWGTGFTGFTFTDAYTSDVNAYPYYGGACVYNDGGAITLADCIIRDMGTREGIIAGTINTYLSRCLISGNGARVCILMGGGICITSCILKDNYSLNSQYGLFYGDKTVINSTIYATPGKTLGNGWTMNSDQSRVYNTIFVNCSNVNQAGPCRGSVVDNCTGKLTGFADDCVIGQAFLARPSENDFSLAADSPAWSAAVTDFDQLYSFADTDFYGNPLIVDGKVKAAGAVAKLTEHTLAIKNDDKSLTVTGLAAFDSVLKPGETVTIAANEAGARPVAGLIVNGVTNRFDATMAMSYTYDDLIAAGGTLTIEPLDLGWYVDPNGDDGNGGFSPLKPKRTLAAIMPKTRAGDTVWAAPGKYNEGKMSFYLPCRVSVPQNVTLKALGKREETFIVGENGTGNVDQWGCSSNDSMRCVHLSAGSCIEGFTLTGGRSKRDNTSSNGSTDCAGVGYEWSKPNETRPWVRDCVISNCVGALYPIGWVNLERCIVVDNVSYNGGLMRGGDCKNVLFARNKTNGGFFAVEGGHTYENVTFANDNLKMNDTPWRTDYLGGENTLVLRNSVFFGELSTTNTIENCVFTSGYKAKKVAPETILFEADYRPSKVAGNPILDAGTNALYADDPEAALDASGMPRIANGTVDIGALEADWRSVYTRDICRRMTIAEASPVVTESPSKGVVLGANGRVVVDLKAPTTDKVPLLFTFRVDGTGTLTATWGDGLTQTFTAAAEEQTLQIRGAGVTRVTFAYTPGEDDTASAELLKGAYKNGLVVVFR